MHKELLRYNHLLDLFLTFFFLFSVQFNFMSLRCMKRGMANASEQSRKLPNVEQ
ncbi:hypothetical protein HanXRQr2_Chr14g0670431 [Helianthus annuus]|uniref:Uncharacterized protein n=1 Tax=Helianthus annuus TaxID=4232 RepID=A0A251SMB6_HELAN|nr:hypothetical protein HanXRQr2_Chr14g0670431 [Helianthus annuus]